MLKSRHVLLSAGAILAVIIILLSGLFQPISSFVERVTLPVMRFSSALFSGSAVRVGLLFSGSSESARLRDLNARIAKNAIDYARLQAVEEENAGLRAQAKFLASSGYDSVGARVISREINQSHAALLIDRGSRDGLERGEAVIANDGIFIGKIVSMSEGAATVELLTDPESRVASSVSGDRKLIGVLEGRGNGAAVLTYIPSSERLARDQIIVTAGTEEKVPGQLPLGIINEVQGKPADPFLSAAIEPIIAADRVLFVSVLRPSALHPR